MKDSVVFVRVLFLVIILICSSGVLGDVKTSIKTRCSNTFIIQPDVIKKESVKAFTLPEERKNVISVEGENNQIKMLTYLQAKRLVKKLSFNSLEAFWVWMRSEARPDSFPRDPDKFYIREWNAHGGILGFLDLKKEDIRIIKEDLLGPMETGFWYYKDAERYIQEEARWNGERIINEAQLRKWLASDKRPSEFPPNPWKTYYQNGWVSLVVFLGTNFMSYEEAQRYIRSVIFEERPITTPAQLKKWLANGEKPERFPSKPRVFYADKGWTTARSFLGTEYMSYEEARNFIQKQKLKRTGQYIRTRIEFIEWTQSGEKPNNFPSGPWIFYAGKGWTDFKDFFGTNFMNYEEAQRYIRSVIFEERPITTSTQLRRWSASEERPRNFPSTPDDFYVGKGWTTTKAFLGTDKMSYAEAHDFIRKVKLEDGDYIRTRERWEQWLQSGQKPDNFPDNPEVFYAGRGWTNIRDFLDIFMSYKQAQAFIQNVKLKNGKYVETERQFYKWRKFGMRPDDFPSNPRRTYADRGWVSVQHFLGTEYMSYPEAEIFIRQQRLKRTGRYIETEKELQEWVKSEERPRNFPSNPWRTYADKGWVSVQHFLGTEYMSYPEAQRYIQMVIFEERPITTSTQLRRWSVSEERPRNFPSNPWTLYMGKGWTTVNAFLGTDKMSYAEAQRYIQAVIFERKPVTTPTQFKRWSKSGERPRGFPSNPWTVYMGKGWVNMEHFLRSEIVAGDTSSRPMIDLNKNHNGNNKGSTESVPVIIPNEGFQEQVISLQ